MSELTVCSLFHYPSVKKVGVLSCLRDRYKAASFTSSSNKQWKDFFWTLPEHFTALLCLNIALNPTWRFSFVQPTERAKTQRNMLVIRWFREALKTGPEQVFSETDHLARSWPTTAYTLAVLNGQRRGTNNASITIILGPHSRNCPQAGTEVRRLWPQTSVSSGQAVCQEQRKVKNSFVLLMGVLPGMTSEDVAAAFKEDANEQVRIPMISRGSDTLEVMGVLAWRAVAPTPRNRWLPVQLSAWFVFMQQLKSLCWG